MTLRFIIGRAGSGKTTYIQNALQRELNAAPDGPPIIVLVPEQATFQTEYSMAAEMDLPGSMRAQALSFRRLAYRVLLETGGAARVPIGELGKRMVLRRLLEQHQASLHVFGRLAGRPGFADCLARSIGELKTYLVDPEHLGAAAEQLGDSAALLRDKIKDLGLLYRELEQYLRLRYTDPDDYLKLLAERVSASDYIKEVEIWVDGFKGFTPLEILVLEQIMKVAGRVNIAICLDPECIEKKLTEDDLFYPTWETFRTLNHLGQQSGVLLEEPVILSPCPPPRFLLNTEIAHLERSYFQYPAEKFAEVPATIDVAAGASQRAEVEACAREIIRLAREEGYRWREMAVFLRDLNSYHDLISNVFRDCEIPLFIDFKPRVMHHQIVALIRAALEVVETNWAYEPVFRFLKTDLIPVDRDSIDQLENYILAHGIRGTRWTDPRSWNYRRQLTLGEDVEVDSAAQDELDKINAVRTAACASLLNFWQKTKGLQTVREFATFLFELLEELQVPEQIAAWKTAAEESGRLSEAREHAQVWAKVVDLLDEVVEALGDNEVRVGAFAEILDAGLESLTIGMIPPGLDQVTVATLDRSRNPELKASFVLGAVDGIIPARLPDDGVFNDTEREKLAELGLVLAPTAKRKTFEENFLIYTALTRAGCRIWVSYPAADEDGRAYPPSPVIRRLNELFPRLDEKRYPVDPADRTGPEGLGYLVRPDQSLAYLTGWLREVKQGGPARPLLWDLYNWYAGNELKEKVRQIVGSVFYDNQEKPLNPPTSSSLYGGTVKTSVSRVEKYIACPFAHFASYALKLKERPVFRLEAPDMGQLFHGALKLFADELAQNSLVWGRLSPDECRNISAKVVDHLAPQLNSEILLSTARLRYLTGKLKRAVEKAAVVLAEHSRRSVFEPVGFEIPFGPGSALPGRVIPLPGGQVLELSGRIDRLDAARRGEEVYLRVIDYKSSDHRVVLPEIFHGLKLQLLTYLHAALNFYGQNGGVVRPAGLLYFTVRDPFIKGIGPMTREEVAKEALSNLRMKGYVLDDPEVFAMMDNLAPSGQGDLFTASLKNDGTFSSRSTILSLQQFRLLEELLLSHFCKAGQGIFEGMVNISPFRYGKDTACTFCSFSPVCKFDTLFAGNTYRVLQTLPEEKIWAAIGREGNQDEQS